MNPWIPVSVGGALIIGGWTVQQTCEVGPDKRLARERLRVISSGIAACTLLVWPVIFNELVGFSNRPLVMLAFLWPAILMLVDIRLARTRSRGSPEQESVRQGAIVGNANGLVGAAFAMGALLMVVTKDRGHSTKSALVVMASLLIAIAFLFPTFEVKNDTDEILLHQAKRSVFHIAIGLFCAGILLAYDTQKGE